MAEYRTAADLPPFDEDADCPKCGSHSMGTIFHNGCRAEFPCWVDRLGGGVVEGHLCRVCGRCGHGWCEATIETKPARRPGLRVVGTGDAGDG